MPTFFNDLINFYAQRQCSKMFLFDIYNKKYMRIFTEYTLNKYDFSGTKI